jgi:hypothetical protein
MARDAAHTVPAGDGRNRFAFSAWLFLRLLALIHLIAFASFWMQLAGLIGPHGLLPAQAYFTAAHEQLGPRAWLELPSLCWIFGSGGFLSVLCAAGLLCSMLLFAGIAPAWCLTLLWMFYLSLVSAGQVFFGFQWDTLLLETTLLAIFLAPWSLAPLWRRSEPPRVARWLLWWLLLRLMFLSGAVKLTSGDPVWRNLTALAFHYETQPLPTTLAWHAHQLPLWFHRAACAAMFAIELATPCLLFAGRRLRHVAALLIAALMALIFLTGNYTFFNLLTVALCVLCLDDAWWARVRRRPVGVSLFTVSQKPLRWLLPPAAAFVFVFTLVQGCARLTGGAALPAFYWSAERALDPFRSLNSYGLFAVMTTTRPELVIEGSDDGREWLAYELPHKPGNPARRPDFVAPFQPRLDWQLWFAALEPPDQNPWVFSLCRHLLQGTPEVLGLFALNPFPHHPPRFIRVIRYEYRFTDAAVRQRTGNWWRRTPLDYYVEPLSLR